MVLVPWDGKVRVRMAPLDSWVVVVRGILGVQGEACREQGVLVPWGNIAVAFEALDPVEIKSSNRSGGKDTYYMEVESDNCFLLNVLHMLWGGGGGGGVAINQRECQLEYLPTL